MQQIEQEYEIEKVLLTGLDNAGKSSIQDILEFLPVEAAKRRIPSSEIEISERNFMKKRFNFFIPPGQEELREKELHGSMKNDYFENVSTFIFVYDSSEHSRIQEAQEELQRSIEDLLEFSPGCSNLILLVHKQDLEQCQNTLQVKRELLDSLSTFFPGIVSKFKIFETSIFFPESIHEAFVKAIARHVGIKRIDFDDLAEWVRKQASARIVLITDANGLLIGESQIGKEDTTIYAAYVAKVFSAMEDFQSDLDVGGIKIVILEDEDETNYSIISRINCSKKNYLAMLIGFPSTQIGMAKIINQKGLMKLKEAYENYKS